MIPFLELKQVTAAHADEIHEAVPAGRRKRPF